MIIIMLHVITIAWKVAAVQKVNVSEGNPGNIRHVNEVC